MKVIKIISIALIVCIIALASFLGYMGMFSTITVSEKEMGPYTFAFKKYVGPYSDTGKVFDTVNTALTSAGVICESGIGVYYDSPADTDSSKLRSDCGSIISEADAAKVKKLNGISISTLPKGMFMTAEFPMKNGLSYMMGPMKVYSAFGLHMSGKKYKPAPGIEIYEMKNNKILYIMPIVVSN